MMSYQLEFAPDPRLWPMAKVRGAYSGGADRLSASHGAPAILARAVFLWISAID
jgi:hypothetical protein